uniref:Uncharacterized protein n=1 Tax=Oryza rufipogon TaxID=4529 RepID=A0A0E0PZZ9_ORYRU
MRLRLPSRIASFPQDALPPPKPVLPPSPMPIYSPPNPNLFLYPLFAAEPHHAHRRRTPPVPGSQDTVAPPFIRIHAARIAQHRALPSPLLPPPLS